ncbi:M23 family metallopeptidase [Limnochorda pilosa]|uniref:M23ase beta-sheet core domain-containing protein n=1 Tax=Limnochorda pilosa TaxID=1555112 RepID=A0A0K2SPI4_LIMPI|nr:M23 family metallopeptidase [Limnochorda pilosa]BAS28912.1 hypothetical protein LIP_3083 [Limnochorda pilosa]
MRERLKDLWQHARVPAASGVTRVGSLARRFGRWVAREAVAAGRSVRRGLAGAFSWHGGLLALRWTLLLAIVAGMGFLLGRARPDVLPAMPWEVDRTGRVAQGLMPVPSSPPEPSSQRMEPSVTGLPAGGAPAPAGQPVAGSATGSQGASRAESGTTSQPETAAPRPPSPAPRVDLSELAVPVQGELGRGFTWWREASTRAWRLHDGVDLVTSPRQPVTAALSGRVARVFRSGSGGVAVWLDHGDGWSTRYGSLSESFVVEGQQVAQGQAVGRVGRLEDGDQVGVHLAVYHDGRPEDPLRFLPALTP